MYVNIKWFSILISNIKIRLTFEIVPMLSRLSQSTTKKDCRIIIFLTNFNILSYLTAHTWRHCRYTLLTPLTVPPLHANALFCIQPNHALSNALFTCFQLNTFLELYFHQNPFKPAWERIEAQKNEIKKRLKYSHSCDSFRSPLFTYLQTHLCFLSPKY